MPTQGSSTARGYDYQHQKLRKQYAPMVAAGQVDCWRCGQRIPRDAPWDLGHDDERQPDGSRKWRGPEHQACNRSTASRHTTMAGPPVDTSRQW